MAAVIHFISCSGGPGQPKQLAEIPVPNNPSKFTFDIGFADQAGHDFIADRSNCTDQGSPIRTTS